MSRFPVTGVPAPVFRPRAKSHARKWRRSSRISATPPAAPARESASASVHVFDGDGIADFVLATSDGANKVIYGSAAAIADPSKFATLAAVDVGDAQSSQTVELVDVDGDGDDYVEGPTSNSFNCGN